MIRAYEYKLKPSKRQVRVLREWLGLCCNIYNQALENRIKAYRERGESLTFYDQTKELTTWRAQVPCLKEMPMQFERDALRRVDRGMKAFFRRCKAGEKPGFPRFKQPSRWKSIECNAVSKYVLGRYVVVPKLGQVRAYSSGREVVGTQKTLRIVERASGWYAQVVTDDSVEVPEKRPVKKAIGIDVGIKTFAAMDDGRLVENPRWLKQEEDRLGRMQQSVSSKVKGSNNRRKAVRKLACLHERVACRRRDFLHKLSREVVDEHDLVAVEKLEIDRMVEDGRYSKGIMDSAWGTFVRYISYKAEWAGRTVVHVRPQGTSQECSGCGRVVSKTIEVRVHRCPGCGLVIDRDVNAARNILARAVDAAIQNACPQGQEEPKWPTTLR